MNVKLSVNVCIPTALELDVKPGRPGIQNKLKLGFIIFCTSATTETLVQQVYFV